jgi:hypothetical protein
VGRLAHLASRIVRANLHDRHARRCLLPAGKQANWLATVPGKGYFAIIRLYGPEEAAINRSWKPSDIEKVN